MKKFDLIFGSVLFILCLILFGVTFSFYQPPTQIAGPSLWPRIILACLGFLSLLLIKQSLQTDNKKPAGQLKDKEQVRILLAIVTIILFTVLFKPLGFALSLPLFYLGLSYILEPFRGLKTWLIRILQSLLVTAAVYVIFFHFLSVKLPLGFLPKKWFYW